MIIDQLPEIGSVQSTDEMPVERGQTTYKTPISKICTAIFASPTLTGTPKAPTADVSTDNTQIATTAFANRAANNAVSTFARPNLLDNCYFVGGGSQLGYGVFPINQRGQGTYMLSSDSYGMDRWASFQVGSKHTLNSDGVLIETNGSNYAQIAQRVSTFPQGVITISFLTGSVAPTNSVRIYLLFSDNTNAYYDCGSLGQNDLGYHTFTVSKTVTEIRFYTNAAGSKFSLQAAMAELGDTQTLAHQENGEWVLNVFPDYATELAKCQAYLLPIRDYTRTRTSLVTRGRMDFEVPLAVPMAKAPSIVGTIRVSSLDGIPQTGFTFDVGGISPATARIRAYKTDHGMTDGFIDSEAVWYLLAE